MNRPERARYHRQLEALRRRLVQEGMILKDEALSSTGGEASGGISNVPLHPADLGSSQYDEDMTLLLLENEERMLEEINAALARLEKGTFGRCEECRQPIPNERLEAIPYARYCVACARRAQPG